MGVLSGRDFNPVQPYRVLAATDQLDQHHLSAQAAYQVIGEQFESDANGADCVGQISSSDGIPLIPLQTQNSYEH